MNVRIWGLDLMDENTLKQAEVLSRHPMLGGHVALMPDAHLGIGATIGSVVLTKDAIIPSVVGVDIGCGMIAVRTDLTKADLPDDLQPLVDNFSRSIPAGMKHGSHTQPTEAAIVWMDGHPRDFDSDQNRTRAANQLGTLGSGNHFLEVSLDENDNVWIVVHSGSRGVGNYLAQSHIKIARGFEQDLEDKDLGWFNTGTSKFDAYIADMLWAQSYAWRNRELMMDEAINQLQRFIGGWAEMERINCHHNFAAVWASDEGAYWLTRKGAIRAGVDDWGIIPGSMGAATYITHGKGNPESYFSSSHGAGRRLSRGAAKREFTVESLKELMGDRAWQRDDAKAFLDEHPHAYKDIDAVMAAQADLTEPVHTLHQIVNYKGD